MTQRFYHATSLEAAELIQKEGLKPIWDYVYLTDSLDSARRWMGFRFMVMGVREYAIVEVEMDPTRLRPGTDHSPLMEAIFGTGPSLTYSRRISPKRIRKIHYERAGFGD